VYDNTTNNPNNPSNPPVSVTAGTSTTNEMLFDSFEWMPYMAGDENINIGQLLSTDSLLASVNEAFVQHNSITSYVYPNPVSESATLIVTNEKTSDCQLRFFDVYGKQVEMKITRKADAFVINKGDLPSGIYFYSLTSGKFTGGGKITVLPQ
jgi:hypothetical protein